MSQNILLGIAKSDKNAFAARAIELEKYGYESHQITNGDDIIQQLVSETADHGHISRVIHFAHGGDLGVYLDTDDGFYGNGASPDGSNSREVSDIVSRVENGEIVFSEDAIWIMGSCNACSEVYVQDPLAIELTEEVGITTIAATGPVAPIIKNGVETGGLITDGSFMKNTVSSYNVSYNFMGIPMIVSFDSKEKADNFEATITINGQIELSVERSVTVVSEDLGNKIDPKGL